MNEDNTTPEEQKPEENVEASAEQTAEEANTEASPVVEAAENGAKKSMMDHLKNKWVLLGILVVVVLIVVGVMMMSGDDDADTSDDATTPTTTTEETPTADTIETKEDLQEALDNLQQNEVESDSRLSELDDLAE